MFFTEEHEAIREMARDFAQRSLAPAAAEIDRTQVFPQQLVDTMAEMGFLGMKIPEAYGGAGMDTRAYALTMEEVARKCAVASVYVSSSNSLGIAPLLLAGSEEQKHKYLPGVAAGQRFIAFALTEPGAGSDAGGMKTTAVRAGEDYILNGRKCFITGAPIAQTAVVFAKTAPEKGTRGITTFLVDMDLPGVSCGKHEEKMGIVGIPTSDLVLEDVRVPRQNVLGEVDMGFVTAMKTLSLGRVGIAAQGVGIAQGAMDEAVSYLKQRRQFGQPLAAFQGLQFMLAEMETKLNAARMLTYHAAWKLDQGEDATKEASMAKYYSAEAAVEIVSKALQMHGGYGYSKEYTIERLYRDVRILPIYEGTSQVQQLIIAKGLLSQ